MNVVFLSPHFPPLWELFVIRLRQAGANVFGIADVPHSSLSWELRQHLTEYYQVPNMHYYDDLVKALGYFTYKHGKIDRIDSHNEYWLETEARLRTDFNIYGVNMNDIDKIKRKSVMKEVFITAGLRPARGKVCHTEEELRKFIKEVGFPVVSKPDIGVGAAKTYKLESENDIKHYFADKPDVDYITEEFIDKQIVTFDGLVDREGKLVYYQSLRYNKGVMDAVNQDSDIYYWTMRDLEPKLYDAGMKTLAAFDLRERFFHFEYFVMDDGEMMPMEVNMRPPGGPTMSMHNYAGECDLFKVWADLIVTGNCERDLDRKYHVMYVGRKHHIPYALSHEQALTNYDSMMVHHQPMEEVFSRAMGNYAYILRAHELQPLVLAAEDIQKRA